MGFDMQCTSADRSQKNQEAGKRVRLNDWDSIMVDAFSLPVR